jgi:hypothetical protein
VANFERPTLPLYQGRSNGCGTTALAMALNSLQGDAPDSLFSQAQLDRGYREPDMFSAPGLLLKIAENYGVYGQLESEITLIAIHNHLHQGHALLWLFSGTGKVQDSHYIVLSGWKEQPETGAISIGFWDPAIRQVEPQWLDASDFQDIACSAWTLWGLSIPVRPILLIFSKQKFPGELLSRVSPLFTMAYWLNRLIYWSYKGLKYLSGNPSEDLTSESRPY